MTIKVTYNVTDVYMSQSVSPVYITVSYSDGGASGGGVWGSITGTLSNQTDLQTALDLKVPYSGATGNVNIGEYELKAGQVTLDTSPTGTAAVGTIRWNDTTGTSETTLKGGNVIIKNGVDLVARVVNKVTPNTTLTKAAYQAVRVSGAQGQRLAIELAQANNDAGSADTIGLVTETIAPNQEGFIMTVGQLEGINTTGSLQGETWVDGDVLYLSPTTAGAITNVKPTGATGHLVVIGYVEYAHANNGKLYVKVMNGFELAELHDTSIVTPTNNQGLFYNSSNSLWENKTISTALGYTPVPTTRNITINGVTYDLSADRTYTISTGISGSGASGQVTYWTGASAVSGSNNLFWDNANGRLGIGTNAPAFDLQIQKSVGGGGAVVANFKNTNSSGEAAISILNDSFYAGFELFGSLYPTAGLRNQALFTTQSGVTYLGFATLGNAPIGFRTNTASGTTNERLTILGNGNVAVNSTSDLGVRFGVVGDTLLRGSGNTSATTALSVQNSDSTAMMQLLNNGYLRLGSGGTSAVRIYPTDTTGDVELSGLSLAFNSRITSQSTVANIGMVMINGLNGTATSGAQVVFLVSKGFAPTSGTGTYVNTQISPTINQTGGANGITRGLYVNPTLTAAADWRSIEWSNNTGWGLYGAGTANNYMGGSLGIGSTSLTGVNFRVGKTITGATTSLGIWVDGRIQSDVTANAILINASATSNASGFNTTNVYHFLADRATYSSTVTNAYGYFADGTIAYATNNYGFYGNIASGTGRWNLYMNGTADNYLAGNLGIGITPTVRLQVSGDTILRGSGATSATTALTVQNSSSTELFSVRNDGSVNIPILNFPSNGVIKFTTANYRFQEFYDGATASNSFLVAHPTVGVFNFGFGVTTASSVAGTSLFNFIISRTGVFLRDTLSTSTSPNASSVLELSSTTRGFLPPRMTTTQKNAIATPAAGLVVYDTTLNKLCVYTTAWETITSV